MYYILYGFLYMFSLLPWKVLYFISDAVYGVLYYIVRYRKAVVLSNLQIAFPEKTEKERIRIAKNFYQQFLDTFIETIKLLSLSEKSLRKRYTINLEAINALYDTGQNLIIVSAHYFNWEVANMGTAFDLKYPLVTAYFPIKNKAFNRLIYDLRTKFNTTSLIDATRFRHQFHPYAKSRFALGLVADQNPGDARLAYWVSFFGKLAPFVKGPEKMSKANNAAVAYLHFYPVKRGYYNLDYQIVTTDPKSFEDGLLTKHLIQITEACVRKQPATYLWSHRRWKHEFTEEYRKLVVE